LNNVLTVALTIDIETFLRLYPRIYVACHRRHVRDPKARQTLSLNQASIIDHLDTLEPTHLHSLAQHMGVTPSTMSLNVDRLEKAGYVRRERDRQDARRIELRLTETGARLKEQQQPLAPELIGKLLKQLKPHQRTEALRGLGLLAEAADQIAANASPKFWGSRTWKTKRTTQ
jgi:DNA-binding MarR family transcriptional regulator